MVYRLALSLGVEAREVVVRRGRQLLLLLFRWLWCQWQSAGMKESLGVWALPGPSYKASPLHLYTSHQLCAVLCSVGEIQDGGEGTVLPQHPNPIMLELLCFGVRGIRISQQRLSPSLPLSLSLSLSLSVTVLIQFGQHRANTYLISISWLIYSGKAHLSLTRYG